VRFSLMRVLDRTVGAWLCRLLGLVLWVLRRHVRRVDHPLSPAPETVREILVIKFLGLGSILQATPLFAALRRRYPRARITLLTFRANRPLRDLQIGVDAVDTVDPSSLWRFLRSNIRALWRLRGTRFDLLLNLEFYATYAALITALLPKRFAIAFGGFAHHRDRFFHDFVSYDSGPHVRQKFMSFARRLGYAGPTPPLARLHVSQPASVMAKVECREGFRLEREDFCLLVNINTSAMATNRRWPLEHYKAVVDRLALRPKVRCILIGGPEDRAAVEDFHARLAWPARVVNLAGKLSLSELAALMQHSDLYLGSDTGPLHVALCLDVPVCVFFGPESPDVFGPPRGLRHSVLYRAEPCSPCINVFNDKHSCCRDNICVKRIVPEQVLALIEEKYLAERAAAEAGRHEFPQVLEPAASV